MDNVELKMRPMSLSKLNVYKSCPRQYFYRHVQGLAQSESKALARGLDIHTQLENLVIKAVAEGADVLSAPPKAVAGIAWFLDELVNLGIENAVAEQEIAYDPIAKEVVPWDYKGPVVRAKLDLMFNASSQPGVLFVVDWKTGQVYEKHEAEKQFYAALVAMYAESKGVEFTHVQAAYAYVDQGAVIPMNYDDASSSARWDKPTLDRVLTQWCADMIEIGMATKFPCTPGQPQCKWCDYTKAKGGVCLF